MIRSVPDLLADARPHAGFGGLGLADDLLRQSVEASKLSGFQPCLLQRRHSLSEPGVLALESTVLQSKRFEHGSEARDFRTPVLDHPDDRRLAPGWLPYPR